MKPAPPVTRARPGEIAFSGIPSKRSAPSGEIQTAGWAPRPSNYVRDRKFPRPPAGGADAATDQRVRPRHVALLRAATGRGARLGLRHLRRSANFRSSTAKLPACADNRSETYGDE